jgi:SAM-dependent methyltransferase
MEREAKKAQIEPIMITTSYIAARALTIGWRRLLSACLLSTAIHLVLFPFLLALAVVFGPYSVRDFAKDHDGLSAVLGDDILWAGEVTYDRPVAQIDDTKISDADTTGPDNPDQPTRDTPGDLGEAEVSNLPSLPIARKMLEEMIPHVATDVFYDLGCGDGKYLVFAGNWGLRAYGCDADPIKVQQARESIKQNKLEEFVTVEQKEPSEVDLSEATILFLHLPPQKLKRLKHQLMQLKPGARVVSYRYQIPGIRWQATSDATHYWYKAPLEEE